MKSPRGSLEDFLHVTNLVAEGLPWLDLKALEHLLRCLTDKTASHTVKRIYVYIKGL